MSQERLAHALGLSFQQVQKYERGANRVSASKLWEIAGPLRVDVAFFFEGLEPAGVSLQPARLPSSPEAFVRTPEGRELVASLARLGPAARQRLLALLAALNAA